MVVQEENFLGNIKNTNQQKTTLFLILTVVNQLLTND